MPVRPLDEGKWQISVSWHLDLNLLAPQPNVLVPDVYGYYGLSDDVVLGTGASFLLVPTCLDLVYYSESSPDEYWMFWGKTKLISSHDNPFMEGGIGYSKTSGETSGVILIGAGMQRRPPGTGNPHGKAMAPVWSLNCGLSGSDAGIDVSHYRGSTRLKKMTEFPVWPPSEDTVLAFAPGEVINMRSEEGRYGVVDSVLILADGKTVVLKQPFRCPDCFYDRVGQVSKWIGDSLSPVTINRDWAIVDFSALRAAIDAGGPVVILRAPQSLVDSINRSGGWKDDTSIGWAAFARPE